MRGKERRGWCEGGTTGLGRGRATRMKYDTHDSEGCAGGTQDSLTHGMNDHLSISRVSSNMPRPVCYGLSTTAKATRSRFVSGASVITITLAMPRNKINRSKSTSIEQRIRLFFVYNPC